MVARLAVLPRVAIVCAACVLATVTATTVTFAASGGSEAPAVIPQAEPAKPAVVVVPDVVDQAYVFAKGSLEETGFAWVVAGDVHGYAANTVVAQAPAAGTRLVDTGLPTITLTLKRNGKYPEKGTPEDVSPFTGTPVQLADVAVAQTTPAPQTTPESPVQSASELPGVTREQPAQPAAAAPNPKPAKKPAAKRDLRKPAFVIPGAPKEPLDEITLDKRARALDAWLAKHPTPSTANVNHWSYQHAWIVTGASFGWSRGAEALRILIGVDRKVEARWGMGANSRALAERTLTEVQARAR